MITGYETLYYFGNKKILNFQVREASRIRKKSKIAYTKENSVVNSMIAMLSVLAQILIMAATGYFAYIGSVHLLEPLHPQLVLKKMYSVLFLILISIY